jgi:L-lactate dehydrogenase complex protein LldG
MSDTRQAMFDRVRAAVGRIADKHALPEYPGDIALSQAGRPPADAVSRFCERLAAVRGLSFTEPAALAAWLMEQRATRGYCDPALAGWFASALGPNITVDTTLARERIDDYQFGITRARAAIAETGTLIFDDATTSSRLAALAPWIHVAVVTRDSILPDVASAIAALGDDPNVLWCTGPSKTADVEGILIEGVHGPGEQVALIRS